MHGVCGRLSVDFGLGRCLDRAAARVNLVKFSDARAVSRSERLRLFFARKEPENHAKGAHQSHRGASFWYFQCLSSPQQHDATRCDWCGDGKAHTLRFRLAYPWHRLAFATASPRPTVPGACTDHPPPIPRPCPVCVLVHLPPTLNRTHGCPQATLSPCSVPTSANTQAILSAILSPCSGRALCHPQATLSPCSVPTHPDIRPPSVAC